MAGHTVTISVLADTKQFARAFKNLSNETGLSKLGRGVKALGKAVAVGGAAAAVGAVALGKKAVGAASDLQQSVGAVDAVFKQNAGTVHAWAKSAAQDLGLSRSEYSQMAAVIGSQLKNMGVETGAVAGQTNDLVKIGADLAAQFGGTTSQAVEALSSLLRGERDPIEQYGVSINQAAIDAKKAEMGLAGLSGEAAKNADLQATLALLTTQTADAQGAFARESNTWAGVQQRLKANLTNISATIGTALLPALTAAAGWLNENLQPAFERLTEWVKAEGIPKLQELAAWFQANLLPTLQQLWEAFQTQLLPALQSFGEFLATTVLPALSELASWVITNRDAILPFVAAIVAGVAAWQAYVKIQAIVKATMAAVKAAQIALNLAMAANPIGLIITAIAALVAGLVYFFTQTETGRELWKKFTDALSAGWAIVKDAFKKGYQAVKEWLGKAWEFIKTVWSYSPYGLIINNWDKIIAFFKGIPGKVKAVFGNAINWLVSAGRNVLSGLRNGVNAVWSKVTGLGRDVRDRVKSAFLGAGRWLYNAGREVLQGLINGLSSALYRVRSIASDIANSLTSGVKSLLGIYSPSRVFRGFGVNVIQGLEIGLGNLAGLRSSMRDVSGVVADGFSPQLAMPGLTAGGMGRPAQAVQVTLQVPPTADTYSIGRELRRVLDDYERVSGGIR